MSAVAVAAIATVGLGAATAAGAFAPGQPAQPNVGAMTQQQIQAEIAETPANYAVQANYNPKFAALNSSIAWQNLFGTPASTTTGTTQAAQTGWYDAQGNFLGPSSMYSNAPANNSLGTLSYVGGHNPMQLTGATPNNNPPPSGAFLANQGDPLPQTTTTPATPGTLATAAAAQPQLLALQSANRAQDVSDVATIGPAAYAAMRAYNPAVTGLYDTMDQQAQDLVNQNGALDPFTQQALQQSYRAGEAARGLAGGSSDAAMESYYQAATQEQRRLTNLGVAGTVAGQTGGYYGDPFMQVLSRTSGGVQTPGVSYTATQPSAVASTADLLNPSLTALQGTGYQATVGTANAAYQQQQQAIGSLITPGANGNSPISTLANFFAAPGGL